MNSPMSGRVARYAAAKCRAPLTVLTRMMPPDDLWKSPAWVIEGQRGKRQLDVGHERRRVHSDPDELCGHRLLDPPEGKRSTPAQHEAADEHQRRHDHIRGSQGSPIGIADLGLEELDLGVGDFVFGFVQLANVFGERC